MKNLKLGVKLIGGFMIVALIVLVVGFFGLNGANRLGAAASDIADNNLPTIASLLTMKVAMKEIDAAGEQSAHQGPGRRGPQAGLRARSTPPKRWPTMPGKCMRAYPPTPRKRRCGPSSRPPGTPGGRATKSLCACPTSTKTLAAAAVASKQSLRGPLPRRRRQPPDRDDRKCIHAGIQAG